MHFVVGHRLGWDFRNFPSSITKQFYGAQSWTSRIVDEQALRVFERTILRHIYGPVCVQGEWRLRTNAELNSSLGHADLVRFI
jgi:hypothetical protein